MRHLIFCGNGCFFLCLEVRKSNIFEAVKESVTTRQAAEYYGGAGWQEWHGLLSLP